MNLNTISDQGLIDSTQKLVADERNLLTKILHHLREIDRRRLFSSMGYKSLFEFTVKHLGYPEDQAYRRISAMKLIKEIPQVENLINQGQISLTHIGLAQSLFKQEKKYSQELKHEEKLKVFDQLSGTSVRQAEKLTFELLSVPARIKPDRVNVVSDQLIELKLTANGQLMDKIETLKGRLAHKHPNISLGELFEKLCDLGLEQWLPGPSSRKQAIQKTNKNLGTESLATKCRKTATESVGVKPRKTLTESLANFSAPRKLCVNNKNSQRTFESPLAIQKDLPLIMPISGSQIKILQKNQMIDGHQDRKSNQQVDLETKKLSKAQVFREVYRKANYECENCQSKYALEIDHIYPKAKGGSDYPSNLRLLCRSCNQRSAIMEFGKQKMENYLNS